MIKWEDKMFFCLLNDLDNDIINKIIKPKVTYEKD